RRVVPPGAHTVAAAAGGGDSRRGAPGGGVGGAEAGGGVGGEGPGRGGARAGGAGGGPPRGGPAGGGGGGRPPGGPGGGGGVGAPVRGAGGAVDWPRAPRARPCASGVPEPLSAAAVPGCRVRVRFAGRLTSGYLLQRTEASEHQGQLAFLERVVSPEPVLTAEVFGLARAVADRYGGTLAGVLPLGSPPRHAAPESATPADV